MNAELAVRLKRLGACPEALVWVTSARGSAPALWQKSPDGRWLLWLASKLGVDHKLLVRAACDCARLSLRYVPKGERRPLRAIQVTERWCRGRATNEEARIARVAASAADAAGYAADAAYAAARKRMLRKCVRAVAKRIPWRVVEPLWEALQ